MQDLTKKIKEINQL